MDLRHTNRSVGKAAFGSSSNRGGFGHAADSQSMKSGSVRDKKDSDFDLEDFTEIMEKIYLEGAIEDKRREVRSLKRAPDGSNDNYKESFLIKFLDQGDAFEPENSLTRKNNRARIP